MDRREALKQTAILMGGAITASTWTAMVTGCERPGKITSFSEENTVNLLSEVAETIIPETDTPGAKAAGWVPFIEMVLHECYEEKDQKLVLKGLAPLKERSKREMGVVFPALSPKNRIHMITATNGKPAE